MSRWRCQASRETVASPVALRWPRSEAPTPYWLSTLPETTAPLSVGTVSRVILHPQSREVAGLVPCAG
jgi:hypothetical protein